MLHDTQKRDEKLKILLEFDEYNHQKQTEKEDKNNICKERWTGC